MKGIICYYSGSGNTKLAVEFLSRQISSIEFDLFDIVKNKIPNFTKYDIAGFAAFTDFGGPSQIFYDFCNNIELQENKPAFVFNTFGLLSGGTLKKLKSLTKSKGFKVISGYSLHTPESYPPMRKKDMTFDDAPNQKEFDKFNEYITLLNKQIQEIKAGNSPTLESIKIGIFGYLMPSFSRKKAKKDFGIQNIKEDICIACGICQKACPYIAIEMAPKPIFNHEKCQGCWACYNHCPEKAIYTPKFKGEHQYPKPSSQLVERLKI